MRFIKLVIGTLITLTIAVFAASNRQIIDVSILPLLPPIKLPLYLLVLALMAVGFTLGGTMVWLNEGKNRKERRKQRREIKNLQKELNTANDSQETKRSSSDFFPALPKRIKK